MKGTRSPLNVTLAFEALSLRIPISDIAPLRSLTPAVLNSAKYARIAASIKEVGIIEPPVVVRDKETSNFFHLLDGHIRIDILRKHGETEVVCLVATEDEAYTYNKRVSKVATIQEHNMVLNAIQNGVPEERLARALDLNISSIRQKKSLTVGLCPEVVELLKDRQVPVNTFGQLKKLKPIRQIEVAELMLAMNRFTISYATSLVAATPDAQLVKKKQPIKGLTDLQISLMEKEMSNLDREFKAIEKDYGRNHLDLVLAVGYVATLLDNVRVVKYLAQHHHEILSQFQKIAELREAA